MARTTEEVAADIASFRPTDDGNWLGLDVLLDELWTTGSPLEGIPAMLRVFERYPEDDGSGVFWTILHGLESLLGYEAQLMMSVRRVPSSFGVTMLGRLLNAGYRQIDEVPIREILLELVKRPETGPDARATAQAFLSRHST
jgi:hypothetical protein